MWARVKIPQVLRLHTAQLGGRNCVGIRITGAMRFKYSFVRRLFMTDGKWCELETVLTIFTYLIEM